MEGLPAGTRDDPAHLARAAISLRRDIYPTEPRRGLFEWDRLPIVLDTSILVNECVRAARGSGGSLLLGSRREGQTHLYATERVRREVERHLARRAMQARVDPSVAERVWITQFLPAIRFVDVEAARSPLGSAAKTLAARHPSDLPTVILAELIAPCLIFARDKDLIEIGATRQGWETVVHNAAQAAELQYLLSGGTATVMLTGTLGFEAGATLWRLSKASPVLALLVGIAVGWVGHSYLTSERGRQHLGEARKFAGEASSRLLEAARTAEEAKQLVQHASFIADRPSDEFARAARVVAVAARPPSAAEVGLDIGVSVQKAASLLRSPIFQRIESRYSLGVSYAPLEVEGSQPAMTGNKVREGR